MSERAIREGTAQEAIEVFLDAFAGYPVMEFVAGADAATSVKYDLIRLFVMGRALRRHPIHVLGAAGAPVGAMTLTPPSGSWPGPDADAQAELDALTESTWEAAGSAARSRYDAFADAANSVDPEEPNWHVNMVGVVGTHQGRGLARILLEAAHARSAADPASRGVSLTTEFPPNVAFYQYLGYEIVGERSIGGLTTWGFFRPDAAGA